MAVASHIRHHPGIIESVTMGSQEDLLRSADYGRLSQYFCKLPQPYGSKLLLLRHEPRFLSPTMKMPNGKQLDQCTNADFRRMALDRLIEDLMQSHSDAICVVDRKLSVIK